MSTRKLKGSTGGCQCCYLIVSFPAVWVLPVDEWNSMKHSQVCVLHNPYTGLSASSSICMWSKTNNRKPHSELYSCVSKNKYCCLLGSVLKVSVLVTLLLLPHKHYVYCLYDMQGSKMSLPRLHVHAHDSFSFCSVFLQVTLLVPRHHTPLHTQRQILQVSRWSAPMWEHDSLTTFFLFVKLCPKGDIRDVERRPYLHTSAWLSQAVCRDRGFAVAKGKCEISHCLKDFSELRALCVDISGS